MDQEPEFTVGSGNVFADLDLPNADELLCKSRVISGIQATIKQLGISDAEAAKKMGMDLQILKSLLRGRIFDWFSLEELNQLLDTLKS